MTALRLMKALFTKNKDNFVHIRNGSVYYLNVNPNTQNINCSMVVHLHDEISIQDNMDAILSADDFMRTIRTLSPQRMRLVIGSQIDTFMVKKGADDMMILLGDYETSAEMNILSNVYKDMPDAIFPLEKYDIDSAIVEENLVCDIHLADIPKIISASKFVANDFMRPVMMRVAIDFNHGQIYGTDAHILYYADALTKSTDKEKYESIIIPGVVVQAMKVFPNLPVRVYSHDRYTYYCSDYYTIIFFPDSRNYPDAHKVIPVTDELVVKLRFDKAQLLKFIKDSSSIANALSVKIQLPLNDKEENEDGLRTIRFFTDSQDDKHGSRAYNLRKSLPCQYTVLKTKDCSILPKRYAINPRYLLRIISNIPECHVDIYLQASNTVASVINGRYIIMPVMVNDYTGE